MRSSSSTKGSGRSRSTVPDGHNRMGKVTLEEIV
jgi:hypothetical protein